MFRETIYVKGGEKRHTICLTEKEKETKTGLSYVNYGATILTDSELSY